MELLLELKPPTEIDLNVEADDLSIDLRYPATYAGFVPGVVDAVAPLAFDPVAKTVSFPGWDAALTALTGRLDVLEAENAPEGLLAHVNGLTHPYTDVEKDWTAPQTFLASLASDTPVALKAAASQSASLMQVQDSAGLVKSAFMSGGELGLGSGVSIRSTTGGKAFMQFNYDAGGVGIRTNADANKGLVIRAWSATQSANLQEWQDSTGAVLSRIRNDGLVIGARGMFATPASAAGTGLVVQALASQTGPLTEWQDSAGTAKARMRASGGTFELLGSASDMRVWGTAGRVMVQNDGTNGILNWITSSETASASIGTAFGTNSRLDYQAGGHRFYNQGNVANQVVAIRGMASQTGDLLALADSTGAALGGFRSNGDLMIGFSAGTVANASPLHLKRSATVSIRLETTESSNYNTELRQSYADTNTFQLLLSNQQTMVAQRAPAMVRFFTFGAPDTRFTLLGGTANVAATVHGIASQTGDLQNWVDSTGAVLARVDIAGTGFNPQQIIQSTNPFLDIYDTDGTVDQRRFRWTIAGNLLTLSSRTDAAVLSQTPITVAHTGLVTIPSLNGTLIGGGDSTHAGDTNRGLAVRATATDWRIYATTSPTKLNIGGSGAGQTFWEAAWNSGPANLFKSASATAAQVVSQFKGAASQTANLTEWADSAGAVKVSILPSGTTSWAGGNLLMGSSAGAGSGSNVLGMANAIAVPSTNPTSGGVLYAEAGALKWRGSAGTVTQLAAA